MGFGPVSDPPKNGLVSHSYVGGVYDKYRHVFYSENLVVAFALLPRLSPISRGRICLTSEAESHILWSHSLSPRYAKRSF